MTNFEKLKNMDLRETANLLCEVFEKCECDKCPVSNLCELGKNGFVKFLESEDE